MTNKVLHSARINSEVKRNFKAAAVALGLKMDEATERALADWAKKHQQLNCS